jgi:geranylgeranyl pyrophosphate synthase
MDRYLRIADGKTAAPLEACARVGAHFAGRDDLQDCMGTFGRHLGIAFQVSDDLLDLRGDPRVTGKPRGTDLRSGAPNAAVLMGMRDGARVQLAPVLAKRTRTEQEVQGALEALMHSGALDEAERLAAEHARRAAEALEALPDSAPRRELLGLVASLAKRVA